MQLPVLRGLSRTPESGLAQHEATLAPTFADLARSLQEGRRGGGRCASLHQAGGRSAKPASGRRLGRLPPQQDEPLPWLLAGVAQLSPGRAPTDEPVLMIFTPHYDWVINNHQHRTMLLFSLMPIIFVWASTQIIIISVHNRVSVRQQVSSRFASWAFLVAK